jgi:mRNA (guanine-N7-)-methyltransferase
MSSQSDFKKDLQQMLMHYLAHLMGGKDNKATRTFMIEELEVRFKPYNKKFFSKNDYDNVISRLMACEFKCQNSNGTNMLRIQTQYKAETGAMQMSNIRTELCGSDVIHQYCENDDNFKKILEIKEHAKKIKFTQKAPGKNGEMAIKKIENKDFNFNVSFNLETDYHATNQTSEKVKEIIDTWSESKKTYRLINRIRFETAQSPIAVDLSILRTSKTTNNIMIPEYTIQESGLFSNQEVCEIELEIINSRVGPGTAYNDINKIIVELQRVIKIVLGGLQQTKYPIPYLEQDAVMNSYMKLIHGEDYQSRRILTRDFIGPSSCTLQLKNIVENENSAEPNLRKNYCATDKADGDRKLMFINKEGRVYLIDTNMRVQFTGCIVDRNDFGNTLIDGENILHDRERKYKNTYAAFDIYFVKGESVRNLNFWVNDAIEITKEVLAKHRYPILTQIVQAMNQKMRSVVKDGTVDIEIGTKMFYFPTATKSIFNVCSELLAKLNDSAYPYETDGVIFTPVNTGVGGMAPGQASKLEKITWPLSFKWKPPAFNTIDFLVAYKAGKEVIHNKFIDGFNMDGALVHQYRTIELRCGFNKKTHMIMNPFQDLLDDNIPRMNLDNDNEETYVAVPFIPNAPYDPVACFANIDIFNGKMMTESGEIFDKDMIVEFSYDLPNKTWIPLRVRHDKTYEFKNGSKNYGNAYHVANDNWKSIHYPVTEEMLRGQNIPREDTNDDVYYNKAKSDISYTQGLRNFHNLYVKKRLIVGVAKPEDTLIDYAVGKGGDISKWKMAKLKFVLGIDVATDNIYNQNDGVCARYLNERKQNRRVFDAIFIPGDSKLNIRDGSAFFKDNERAVAKAILSNSTKEQLGKAVTRSQGIGVRGFNVSSCQFAIHYMFENNTVLHGFLRNVSECTKVGGYFIGTCYDGQTVFKKLANRENYSIHVEGKMIFDIQKKYKQTGFSDDETSAGYPISVYQESINKYATEFLVNFDYLVRLMEDYGFKVISLEEAKTMGFPSGSGLFEDLFRQMNKETNRAQYGEAQNMSREEKEISFLNRYFIFRKTHEVKADKVFAKLGQIEDKDAFEEVVKETLKKPTMFIQKLKRKVRLNKYEAV